MIGLIEELPSIENFEGWPWTVETSPTLYFGKKNWPKITIITPSFNQGSFIEQTIRSILLQNYPNLEYIVIDGGSSDNTVEILEKYSKWITYWISEPDAGQSDAINKGLVKSTGDLFNWINSDDFLATECLFLLGIQYNLNKDVYLMDISIVNFDNSKIISTYSQKVAKDISETIVDHLIAQPSSFYKLNIVKKIGGIANNFHFVMDLFLWIRYLLEYGQKHIEIIPKTGAFYREHANTKTKLLADKFEEETLEVLYFARINITQKSPKQISKFSNFEIGLQESEKKSILSAIKQRHFFLFKKNLLQRNYSLALKYFKEYLLALK